MGENPVFRSLFHLAAVSFILIGGVAEATVYKWVDEAGRVNYGDRPPVIGDAQSPEVLEDFSPEEVGPMSPQLHEKPEQPRDSSKETTLLKPAGGLSRPPDGRIFSFDDVACFSPLSDPVKGSAAAVTAAIRPTSLTEMQQESLRTMFGMVEARWRGRIAAVKCAGDASAPTITTTHFEADATGEWIERQSRLILETKMTGEEDRSVKRLTERFEVADALYFSDFKSTGTVALKGNEVEVLSQTRNMVTFLIKRWLPTGAGGRLPHAEIRQLDVSGGMLRQTELYYYGGVLTGRRTWVINR